VNPAPHSLGLLGEQLLQPGNASLQLVSGRCCRPHFTPATAVQVAVPSHPLHAVGGCCAGAAGMSAAAVVLTLPAFGLYSCPVLMGLRQRMSGAPKASKCACCKQALGGIPGGSAGLGKQRAPRLTRDRLCMCKCWWRCNLKSGCAVVYA
jgi:hypothetical protein